MEIDNQKSEPTAASVSMAAIVICSAMLFGAVSFLAAITLILSQGSEESIILTKFFPGFGLVQMTVSAVGVIGGILLRKNRQRGKSLLEIVVSAWMTVVIVVGGLFIYGAASSASEGNTIFVVIAITIALCVATVGTYVLNKLRLYIKRVQLA